MPDPPPASLQFARWASVAVARRGYQRSGTAMDRPSASRTLSLSPKKLTSRTRSPCSGAEELMPCLQKFSSMLLHYAIDPLEFRSAEARVPRQRDRPEPELRRAAGPIHVNVRRFVWLMAVEVEPIGAGSENGRDGRLLAVVLPARIPAWVKRPSSLAASNVPWEGLPKKRLCSGRSSACAVIGNHGTYVEPPPLWI